MRRVRLCCSEAEVAAWARRCWPFFYPLQRHSVQSAMPHLTANSWDCAAAHWNASAGGRGKSKGPRESGISCGGGVVLGGRSHGAAGAHRAPHLTAGCAYLLPETGNIFSDLDSYRVIGVRPRLRELCWSRTPTSPRHTTEKNIKTASQF
jgi:hypothetical protein